MSEPALVPFQGKYFKGRLNGADHLPPVECPLLIEVLPKVVVLAERTSFVPSRNDELEYRIITDKSAAVPGIFINAVISGKFRWTYP